MAWDTVCADYQASVRPRPRRDGALDIAADHDALAALLERVRHLSQVTHDSASQLGAHPANGDLGYSDWFKAIAEELIARCEAVRWRLLALDPAKAGDFAAAHDQQAADTASLRAQSAERAAARSQQAFAALQQRARL
jgi:hypothetical protein